MHQSAVDVQSTKLSWYGAQNKCVQRVKGGRLAGYKELLKHN